jgi:hypothetical protein
MKKTKAPTKTPKTAPAKEESKIVISNAVLMHTTVNMLNDKDGKEILGAFFVVKTPQDALLIPMATSLFDEQSIIDVLKFFKVDSLGRINNLPVRLKLQDDVYHIGNFMEESWITCGKFI